MTESFYMGIYPVRCGSYTIITVIRVDMGGFALDGGFIFFADLVPHILVILYDDNIYEAYSLKTLR